MQDRRVFLKNTLAVSAFGVALAAGVLKPAAVQAAWPEAAFAAKSVDDALKAAYGSASTMMSDKIDIRAPEIAENGAVVPVEVKTSIAGVKRIDILAAKNGTPMIASFEFAQGTVPEVSTRIKLGQTSDVVAVVHADGQMLMNKREVKVTIGGCGG